MGFFDGIFNDAPSTRLAKLKIEDERLNLLRAGEQSDIDYNNRKNLLSGHYDGTKEPDANDITWDENTQGKRNLLSQMSPKSIAENPLLETDFARLFPQSVKPESIDKDKRVVRRSPDSPNGFETLFEPDITDNTPAEIKTALYAAGGDHVKARAALLAKGMDGEWAIDSTTKKTAYVPKSALMADTVGRFLKVPTGMKITSDGQGGLTIATGDQSGGGDMTTPVKTDLQKKLIEGNDALAAIDEIESRFKPEYQQLGPRWSNFATAAKEKAGLKVSPEDQQALSDFSGYQRETASNLNSTIKNLTGATVGVDEAPRLMLQVPVAGQGLFDGDSPTQFQSKLQGTKKQLQNANMRAAYSLKNGLNKDQQFAIPLGSVPSLVNKKGEQYAKDLKRLNPNASDTQIKAMVKTRLRGEFGLE